MGIKIIVGGQFGGEGKGKVSHYLAKKHNIDIVVRVGGSNSGHTVIDEKGKSYILRQLPTPSIIKNTNCVISAGTYIDIDILFKEISQTNFNTNNLFIDKNAMIISKGDLEFEKTGNLRRDIGSTSSGTGASVVRRIERKLGTKLAKDINCLKPFIIDTKAYLNNALELGKDIIIEGTQGYGLSLLHSPYYPYTTSRDTTAAGFLSEVGLSPLYVDEIILVIRSYPIRVEGNSGELINEITWDSISKNPEYSSVTNKVRRVATFDSNIVKEAILSNNPTSVVLNHLDYLNYEDRGRFIKKIENEIKQEINYIGVNNKDIYETKKIINQMI